MTAIQQRTIAQVEAQLEAERFEAEQAAREVAELDVLSIYYVVKAKIEAGRIDEAKAIVAQWKGSK